MSNPEIIIVPVTFGIPALVVLAFRWFKHRERMAPLAPPEAQHAPALEARLARIEQAVEAVAIEMERVSEGQRFVTRLLAERAAPMLPDTAPASLAQQRGRVVTPH